MHFILKSLCSLLIISVIAARSEAHSDFDYGVCPFERNLWYNGKTLSIRWANERDSCCACCKNNPLCYSFSYNRRSGYCYLVGYSLVKVYDYGCKLK